MSLSMVTLVQDFCPCGMTCNLDSYSRGVLHIVRLQDDFGVHKGWRTITPCFETYFCLPRDITSRKWGPWVFKLLHTTTFTRAHSGTIVI